MDKAKKINSLKNKRDKIRAILNRPDPLMQSFFGGRVGFKSGKNKIRHEKQIEKELYLHIELGKIQEQINRLENPLTRSKPIEVPCTIFQVGETALGFYGNKVTIVKINAKTVTIQYEGGFKETVKPHLLDKVA